MSLRAATLWFVALLTGAALCEIVAAQQGPPTRSVWDGVYSAVQAKRGEPLYSGQCAACHGSVLEGGEMAPPLSGGAFTSNWNGLSLGDLAERIRISMPQSRPGSLSRQECADVVAFMLSVGNYPAGQTELPRELELLKQIRLDPMKP
jgi:cytochrome c